MRFLKLIATLFFLVIGVIGVCALQKHFIAHTNGKIISPIIISFHNNESAQAVTPGHSFDMDTLDDCIVEEDNDDVATSVRKKISSEKYTFNISFISSVFSDNSFNKIRPSEYFYHSYPHSFISLKVFRL